MTKQSSPFKLIVIITLLVFAILAAIIFIGNNNSKLAMILVLKSNHLLKANQHWVNQMHLLQ